MENVTSTTVIMEPAIMESILRAPAAPAPKRRGQRLIHFCFPLESAPIKITARRMPSAIISEGKNQKLSRRTLQVRLTLFKVRAPREGVGQHARFTIDSRRFMSRRQVF